MANGARLRSIHDETVNKGQTDRMMRILKAVGHEGKNRAGLIRPISEMVEYNQKSLLGASDTIHYMSITISSAYWHQS